MTFTEAEGAMGTCPWRVVSGVALSLVLAGVAGPTCAQEPVAGAGLAHGPVQAAAGSRPVCVDAEIDGVRALSYDCLSQRLAPPAAIGGGAASESAAGTLAKGPSNWVGTFNLSAERNRFGANWGKSVTPQRPPPLQAVPVGR